MLNKTAMRSGKPITCLSVLKEMKKGPDPVLIFWKAFGIFQEGSVTEAIRELTRIQERREVQYGAAVALIYYHERCRHID